VVRWRVMKTKRRITGDGRGEDVVDGGMVSMMVMVMMVSIVVVVMMIMMNDDE